MITTLNGMFGLRESMLEISGSQCSNQCLYCFANFRAGLRKANVKSVINYLMGKNPNSFIYQLIKKGYPICYSNHTDPFSKNNYIDSLAILPYLATIQNGIYFQTKGNYGIDGALEILKDKKNIVWFVTVTCLNDDIRKDIEPNASSVQDRLDMIEKLRKAGQYVVVGFNPLHKDWLPPEDLEILIEKFTSLGIKDYTMSVLHFGLHDINKLNASIAKKSLLKYYKNDKSYIDGMRAYMRDTFYNLQSKGINVYKMFSPTRSEVILNGRKILGKSAATLQEVVNYCFDNNKSGLILNYDKYLEIMCKGNEEFYERKFKGLSASYILTIQRHDWINHTETQSIDTFTGILKHYWNSKRIDRSLQNNLAFRLLVDDNNQAVLDKNNNIQLFFDGNWYREERTINYKKVR